MKKTALLILVAFIALLLVFDKFIMPYYISHGSVTTVPDVTNKRYDDAASELQRAGFKTVKSYNIRYLARVDSSIVLSQTPVPGTEVKPGRIIYLVVNRREKPSFPMPDLIGKTEFDARSNVVRLELNLQPIQTSSVNDLEQDGKVLAQSVAAQTVVRSGDAVSITVGRYEAPPPEMRKATVPDVLGMSLVQAQQTVFSAGLRIGKVTTESSAMLVPNTVISQKPSVGTNLQPGQSVELTVSKPE
ncbi:MAG: PASTA domain-containing protein [Chlorobiaceae bacterium]|nr:PASTA domain-containing protein [Chlorobiaceae bacterium]